MKNIYKHIVLIAAALTCSTALMAQMQPGTGADGIVFNKTTQEISPNNYEITIDAFVTGTTQTIEDIKPCDIVLVLDLSSSMQNNYVYVNGKRVTRLEALKLASQQFIQTIYDKNPKNTAGGVQQYHKVATVVFNREAKTYISLQDVNASNLSTMKTSIGNLKYTELSSNERYYKVTNPAIGINQAAKVLDAVKDDGRSKVVVFFTDGEPCDYGTDDFNDAWAREAVNMSYVLKQPMTASFNYTYKDPKSGNTGETYTSGYGAKVYSVAILSSESARIRHFLHFVSSNYPDENLASNYKFPTSNTGSYTRGGEAPHEYYQLSNGSDLSAIFEKIAKDSSNPDINLTETSSATVDVLSEYFVLPSSVKDGTYYGNSGEAIELYVSKVNGYNSTSKEYTFDAGAIARTAKDNNTPICPNIKAVVSEKNGNRVITVTGFDYAKYCVGEVENSSPKAYKGYKLTIKIKIEINPDNPGGANVPSNAAGSGIYDNGRQVAEFQQPNVHIPNIVIIKQGLKKGESATFTVTGKDEDNKDLTPITLVATCKADGADAVARVKIQKPGRYTVTESTWSWAYSVSELVSSYTKDDSGTTTNAANRSITRNVNEKTEDSTYSGTPFIFKNSAKSGMPDHGESYKPNVFTIQQ